MHQNLKRVRAGMGDGVAALGAAVARATGLLCACGPGCMDTPAAWDSEVADAAVVSVLPVPTDDAATAGYREAPPSCTTGQPVDTGGTPQASGGLPLSSAGQLSSDPGGQAQTAGTGPATGGRAVSAGGQMPTGGGGDHSMGAGGAPPPAGGTDEPDVPGTTATGGAQADTGGTVEPQEPEPWMPPRRDAAMPPEPFPRPEPIGPSPPLPGQLLISELMSDPSHVPDSQGEWVEVSNVSRSELTLAGCTLGEQVGAGAPFPSDIVMQPGKILVLARSAEPGFEPDMVVSMGLSNTADSVVLSCGTLQIDAVVYDKSAGYALVPGASLSRDPAVPAANGAAAGPEVFCAGAAPYGTGDLGTPGQPNPPCPAP